jgi:hypothetical protein
MHIRLYKLEGIDVEHLWQWLHVEREAYQKEERRKMR